MKKKIVTISALAVLMLVAISFATAINTTNTENKESPLYGLRTSRATGEKISNLIENIKTKFLGDRTFFIPFSFLYRNDDPSHGGVFHSKTCNCVCEYTNQWSYHACNPTCGMGQMSSVCGGGCSFDEVCHTVNDDICRIFCLNK